MGAGAPGSCLLGRGSSPQAISEREREKERERMGRNSDMNTIIEGSMKSSLEPHAASWMQFWLVGAGAPGLVYWGGALLYQLIKGK